MNICPLEEDRKSDSCKNYPLPGNGLYLGIAAVPFQPWQQPYTLETALKQGTLFPCLDLPFYCCPGRDVTGGGLNG